MHISTHAPLARRDLFERLLKGVLEISTHAPLARCDDEVHDYLDPITISTHAPLARCDASSLHPPKIFMISTHAPLARCDLLRTGHSLPVFNFNSRTSCEVRPGRPNLPFPHLPFQLTHLLRGATLLPANSILEFLISTHAPLARCDTGGDGADTRHRHFNSRTSCEVRRT